jgi:hypothetical protein
MRSTCAFSSSQLRMMSQSFLHSPVRFLRIYGCVSVNPWVKSGQDERPIELILVVAKAHRFRRWQWQRNFPLRGMPASFLQGGQIQGHYNVIPVETVLGDGPKFNRCGKRRNPVLISSIHAGFPENKIFLARPKDSMAHLRRSRNNVNP